MNNKVIVSSSSPNLFLTFYSTKKIEENMSLFFCKIQFPMFIVRACDPMLEVSLASPLVSN